MDSELESYYKVIQAINDDINVNNDQRNDTVNRDQETVLETLSEIEEILTLDESNKIEIFLYLTEIGFDHTDGTEHRAFEFVNLLHSFPRVIIIPTIRKLGRMSINKAYGTGVVFINLDRTPGSYENFLTQLESNAFLYIDDSQIRSHFQSMLGRLTKAQREIIEVIYFYATYPGVGGGSLEEFYINEEWKELAEVENEEDEILLKQYGHLVGEDVLRNQSYDVADPDEFHNLYIQLLISSWIEGRGIEETVIMVEKYLDQEPGLKEEILEKFNKS